MGIIPALSFALVAFIAFALLPVFVRNIVKTRPRPVTRNYVPVYSDAKSRTDKALASGVLRCKKYGLSGKPDFIYKNKFSKKYMPVELKSGYIKSSALPYYGDLIQLAAYFALVEEQYGARPSRGRLVYKDYMFIVKNTRRLRKNLLKTLRCMRFMLDKPNVTGEPDFAKCRYCMCRGTVCEHNKY